MIANFFQNLDRHKVEHLLISGQATVLYGAATFSEDIDLWINPTEENRVRFLAALSDCGACYYKLTPLFSVEHLQQGHGFHFILPGGDAGEVFLDVMGNPPRAGLFADSLATARWMETEWGLIRTIGIKPLVELKKNAAPRRLPGHWQARARLVRPSGMRRRNCRSTLGVAQHFYTAGTGNVFHQPSRRRCCRPRSI